MSAVNQGDKSEPVVNVTVNNNTSSGTKCNSSLISICNEPDNRRPLSQVKPVSTTMAALVQAYLTLNDMASVTRSSDKNLCAPNNTMVTSTPLVSVVPIKEVKCDIRKSNQLLQEERIQYLRVNRYHQGQVDILISKNQALQILYLKHYNAS